MTLKYGQPSHLRVLWTNFGLSSIRKPTTAILKLAKNDFRKTGMTLLTESSIIYLTINLKVSPQPLDKFVGT